MYLLKKVFHPEIFQGKYKEKNYFEGWYYKIIDSKMENTLAFIPGVSFDKKNKDTHAFIQILDATREKSYYFPYDIACFQYNQDKFEIKIGDNYFSSQEMRLNIKDQGLRIQGELSFENIIQFPKTLLRPGIMGPYSFVPFMECYHGIINIHHDIIGQLNVLGNQEDFTKGYGYIEKDWGKSFPESWVWFQSNHFDPDDITLMFSIAKIPWIGRSFLGFISFIRIKNEIYTFSTYTKAKVIKLHYYNNQLKVMIEDQKYKIEMVVDNSKGVVLKAPKNGLMDREILESINAVLEVKLSSKTGEILYEGMGRNTGLEIVGEVPTL